jgi:hypothetical protein
MWSLLLGWRRESIVGGRVGGFIFSHTQRERARLEPEAAAILAVHAFHTGRKYVSAAYFFFFVPAAGDPVS